MNNAAQVGLSNILKEQDAAKYIGMSRSFLRQDRMNGHRKNRTKGPNYIKIGRNIRYHLHDLDAWIEANRITQVTNVYT